MACIFLNAVCTTHEAVEVIPHQMLQFTRLEDKSTPRRQCSDIEGFGGRTLRE